METAKRKLLQDVQTSLGWNAVEDFIQEYIEKNINLDNSAKRDSGFNTIWDRAFAEGGKHHIIQFFNSLEEEARKYNYDKRV